MLRRTVLAPSFSCWLSESVGSAFRWSAKLLQSV